MSKVIAILIEEHHNIEKLLRVLEQELDVFDRSDRPDYEILQAVIEYFRDYPETYHHPKEDMVFQKLKLRDPAVAARVGDVEAEHAVETQRLASFADAVEHVLAGREMLRKTFHDIVLDFIAHQRRHMDEEERLLFPAAVSALQKADWSDIEARLNNRKDPLFDSVSEKKYHALRGNILRWEQESNANRGQPHRVRN